MIALLFLSILQAHRTDKVDFTPDLPLGSVQVSEVKVFGGRRQGAPRETYTYYQEVVQKDETGYTLLGSTGARNEASADNVYREGKSTPRYVRYNANGTPSNPQLGGLTDWWKSNLYYFRPDRPVAVGETWTCPNPSGSVEYKFVGTEKFDGKEYFRIDLIAMTAEQLQNIGISGKILVETKSKNLFNFETRVVIPAMRGRGATRFSLVYRSRIEPPPVKELGIWPVPEPKSGKESRYLLRYSIQSQGSSSAPLISEYESKSVVESYSPLARENAMLRLEQVFNFVSSSSIQSERVGEDRLQRSISLSGLDYTPSIAFTTLENPYLAVIHFLLRYMPHCRVQRWQMWDYPGFITQNAYRYVGDEKVDGVDCYRINAKMRYCRSGGDGVGSGTIWINRETRELEKFEGEFSNLAVRAGQRPIMFKFSGTSKGVTPAK